MSHAIMNLVEGAMSSPWVYAALFAFAAIDGFFPLVPSESLVISAGVFAASGEPSLPLVIAAAALGALAGDHVSFYIGRTAGARMFERAQPGTRRSAAFDWAGKILAERGGQILVVCRYIPGARTAITLTAGSVGYPLRSFTSFDAVASASWGTYCALVGYLGGAAFEDEPFKGLALGFGLAMTVTAAIEVVRHLRRRERAVVCVER
jgi:membrane protein DedA with SNARE-associated domain